MIILIHCVLEFWNKIHDYEHVWQVKVLQVNGVSVQQFIIKEIYFKGDYFPFKNREVAYAFMSAYITHR